MIMRYSFKPCAPSSLFFGSWSLSAVRALVLSSWGKEQHRVWKFLLNSGAVTSSGNFITKEPSLLWLKLTVCSLLGPSSVLADHRNYVYGKRPHLEALAVIPRTTAGSSTAASGMKGQTRHSTAAGLQSCVLGLACLGLWDPGQVFFNFSQPHPAFPLKSVSPASCG